MENTNQETIELITEVTGLLPGTIEKYQWLVACMERYAAVKNLKQNLAMSKQKELIRQFINYYEDGKDDELEILIEKAHNILNEE